MIASAEVPTYEVLASDEYWKGEIHFHDARFSQTIPMYFDKEKSQEIGNLVLDLTGGMNVRKISEGNSLPLIAPDLKQVIRIIEDSRKIYWNHFKIFDQNVAKFQQTIEDMSSTDLYLGSPAVFSLSDGGPFVAKFKRSVWYARSLDDENFVAIPSGNFIDTETFLKCRARIIPRLKVGDIYSKGLKDKLFKVVSADILEPIGSLRRPPNNPRRSKQSSSKRIRIPVPSPALGLQT